jgi:hypothetical protein
MAKIGFTNQQCNKININVLLYTLRSTRLSHHNHILMSNALISPLESTFLSMQVMQELLQRQKHPKLP